LWQQLKEKVPENFNEVWNHPDITIREKWCAAMKKEFHNKIRRGVWRPINRRDLPQGRRLVKNKWMFDMKKNKTRVMYIGVWVDDSLIVGDLGAIDTVIADVMKLCVSLKVMETLRDYLSW